MGASSLRAPRRSPSPSVLLASCRALPGPQTPRGLGEGQGPSQRTGQVGPFTLSQR